MTETLRHARYVLGENPITLFAFALFSLLVLCAILGPSLVPYDPLASDTARALTGPSAAHLFGTDQLGRDIFSRIIVATRLATRKGSKDCLRFEQQWPLDRPVERTT